MRRVLAVAACAVLVGCSDGAVKDAVLESLIDPGSARFGKISYSDGGDHACVEVNAKNRMGGYTGESQMVVAKFDGEWAAIDDYEASHKSCVELINEMENNEGN